MPFPYLVVLGAFGVLMLAAGLIMFIPTYLANRRLRQTLRQHQLWEQSWIQVVLYFIGTHPNGVVSQEIADGCDLTLDGAREFIARMHRQGLIEKRHPLIPPDDEVTREPAIRASHPASPGMSRLLDGAIMDFGPSQASSDQASRKRYFLTDKGRVAFQIIEKPPSAPPAA